MGSNALPAWCFRLIAAIDRLSQAVGHVISWAVYLLVAAVSYECIARYVFSRPTEWAYDIGYMLNGSMFMLGCGYALLKGAHVRTDILWDRFTPRTRGMIDLVSYVLLFFPVFLALLFIGLEGAWSAYIENERSEQSAWRPVMWPFKAAVPAGALLLLVQAIAEVLKCIYTIRVGEELQHRDKVEV